MKIYSSTPGGDKFDKYKQYDLGVLISSSPTRPPTKEVSEFVCALDNGAFGCWNKGYPFMERAFLDTLYDCYKKSIKLEFIVCPDLIAQGQKSLRFSLRWANERLCGCPCLALAVQDGLTPQIIHKSTSDIGFKYIFVGGTIDWKWSMAKEWVNFAHDNDMKCHVGRVGTIERLHYCKEIGADSCDSSSFVRNDSWHILEDFTNNKRLFD